MPAIFARLLSRNELHRGRVHAVAQAGRLGTVVEDMAKVRATTGADHLGAVHTVAVIGASENPILGDGRPEARPAGARIELLIRAEEHLSAVGTDIGAALFIVPVGVIESRLGARLAR